MCLDRRAQLVFGVAISLVRVGMVHFETLLIATPDLFWRRVRRKPEYFEGLGLENLQFSRLERSFFEEPLSCRLAGID